MTIRRIPTTGSSPHTTGRDAVETPISMLALLEQTLSDHNRTANAKDLLNTVAKAVAGIVLSFGVVLLAAAVLVLAVARSPISGPAVGAILALGGAGLTWSARWLYNRIRQRQTRTRDRRES